MKLYRVTIDSEKVVWITAPTKSNAIKQGLEYADDGVTGCRIARPDEVKAHQAESEGM